MLDLGSARWRELQHAYGAASNIPALLGQLTRLPSSQGSAEPWCTLWSALAHQGDVYSASFAAVPHVIEALSRDPARADASFFQFPAWVEICWARSNAGVPPDLERGYREALKRRPGLVADAVGGSFGRERLACALAAVAAAAGDVALAEAVLELAGDGDAEAFIEECSGG